MASLPGFPGNLGLPAGNGTNSDFTPDLAPDLPTGGGGPITIANRTYKAYPFPDSSASGSFAIPATTDGNLLVIFVANTYGNVGLNSIAVSDDSDDLFAQVPWPSLAGSGASAGQITPDITLYNPPPTLPPADQRSGGQFDSWYTTTTGGATTVTWALTGSAPTTFRPEFWVYELTGFSAWAVIDFKNNFGAFPSSGPFHGPSLNGTASDNAYFFLMLAGEPFLGDETLDPPWTLDPDANYDFEGIILGYILDSTGARQASVNLDDPSGEQDFVSWGVVFGPTGSITPPTDDDNLPSVFVVC